MGSRLTENTSGKMVLTYQADGSSDPDTATVDMAGYDECTFICHVATITGSGTVSMQVKGSATDAVGAAISGAVAQADTSTDSDKLLVVNVVNPAYRYLSATVTRAVANSIISGVIAIRSKAKSAPCSWDSGSLAAAVVEQDPAA
jgi:hypothetical protein